MTERKFYSCDFNPNTAEHPAAYRLNDGEHESLGMGSKDACAKHLPAMVDTAVTKLTGTNRVCISRLPGAEARPRIVAFSVPCEVCGQAIKAVPGYFRHMRQSHDTEPVLDEVRVLFDKAKEAATADH